MKLRSQDFQDEKRLEDIACYLQVKLCISASRDIVLLLDDSSSKSNNEAIQRWIKPRIWQQLRDENEVDLACIEDELLDALGNASVVN